MDGTSVAFDSDAKDVRFVVVVHQVEVTERRLGIVENSDTPGGYTRTEGDEEGSPLHI
ncbi:hypothetical protein HAL_12610 [Haladaptatus sp. T7]|nr:hypothetical protein HAL_12610 [Haladaptatus sp. T7]